MEENYITPNKEYYVRINSNAPGKHCDLYPAMGVFIVKDSEKGKEVQTRRASWIPSEFDFVILPPQTLTKDCPYCKTAYELFNEFIDSNQTGEEKMCITCFERRHIVGDKYAYKNALRQQILKELEL